jgi:hypothetical protein
MRQRRETVEHPFGTMKARMGATHFLTKTLPKVAAEMALSVLAYKSDTSHEHRWDQATDGCDRGLRPNRSRLLTNFPWEGRFYTAKTRTGRRLGGNRSEGASRPNPKKCHQR